MELNHDLCTNQMQCGIMCQFQKISAFTITELEGHCQEEVGQLTQHQGAWVYRI